MRDLSHPEPNAPPNDEVAADGTDLTLIRWFLSLSPTERIRYLEDNFAGVMALRESAE